MKYISADILIHNNIFLWSKNFYVILYKKPYFHYCILLYSELRKTLTMN